MKWIIVLSDGETWEELKPYHQILELYTDEDYEKLKQGIKPKSLKPEYTHSVLPPFSAESHSSTG